MELIYQRSPHHREQIVGITEDMHIDLLQSNEHLPGTSRQQLKNHQDFLRSWANIYEEEAVVH